MRRRTPRPENRGTLYMMNDGGRIETMTWKHIIYVSRAGCDCCPASDTLWQKDGEGFTIRLLYIELCHDMRNHWRHFLKYDEQESGDFADWLKHGPFHAMRYYPH